ncbi:putative uncharacterized protein [Clostridium sp. CAG:609]|nr:putative uncharacterized protein [Clostridium sp. CAG:609]
MEVCVSLWNKHKFINRGFLIGPYCPIYGWGCLAIIIIVGQNTSDILSVFLKSILICSLLEYFTSYFMEKIYNVRWWDYSNKKFNINGRICLETMIPFGLLASLIIYVLHPAVIKLVNLLSPESVVIIASILFVIYIIDNIVSTYILFKIKGKIKSERKDNTEKIKQYIEKWFQDNTVLYRRIKNAFPKFQVFIKELEKYKIVKDKEEK